MSISSFLLAGRQGRDRGSDMYRDTKLGLDSACEPPPPPLPFALTPTCIWVT